LRENNKICQGICWESGILWN